MTREIESGRVKQKTAKKGNSKFFRCSLKRIFCTDERYLIKLD